MKSTLRADIMAFRKDLKSKKAEPVENGKVDFDNLYTRIKQASDRADAKYGIKVKLAKPKSLVYSEESTGKTDKGQIVTINSKTLVIGVSTKGLTDGIHLLKEFDGKPTDVFIQIKNGIIAKIENPNGALETMKSQKSKVIAQPYVRLNTSAGNFKVTSPVKKK